MSRLPQNQQHNWKSPSRIRFFQGIMQIFHAIFGRFLPFLNKASRVDDCFHPNDLNMQTLEGPSSTEGVMAGDFHLPQVSFSKMKSELAATEPGLATMTLDTQRKVTIQSWTPNDAGVSTSLQENLNPCFRMPAPFGKRKQGRSFTLGTTQFPYPATNLRSRNISRPVSFGKIKDELTTSYPSFAMVPTKPTHAPEEFHLFKKLPMELQIEVWRYALDEIGARVISLEPGRCNIPGMIHACQMSRQEASNKFRFCVSRQGGKKLFRFIDFKNDILHLPSEPVEGVLEETSIQPLVRSFKDCLPSVTQLALNLTVAKAAVSTDRLNAGTDLWTIMPKLCPALQYLHIIVTLPKMEPGLDETALGSEKKNLWWIKKIYASEIGKWSTDSEERVDIGRLMVTLAEARLKVFGMKVELGFATMQPI